MSVKTSTFTGWRLSGKDAEAFVKQVDESKQNASAQEALKRGRALCKQITDNGYSAIKPKKIGFFKTAYCRLKRFVTIK